MPRRGRRRTTRAVTTPVLHPHAAGIDIGATELYVCVPLDRDPQPIRRFGTFTEDLRALATWLQECGVTSVAMESTGVYWIPLYQILETRGVAVCLVNARHVKNVPGRKTDVQDCQWLQYLHSVGLLRGSFRPPETVCAVRSLLRHRDTLVQLAATHTQHMQKALTQMNLQLHHVLSDITGVTGLAILDAILAGERDPPCSPATATAASRPPRRPSPRPSWATTAGASLHPASVPRRLPAVPATARGVRSRRSSALLGAFASTIDPAQSPAPSAPPRPVASRAAPPAPPGSISGPSSIGSSAPISRRCPGSRPLRSIRSSRSWAPTCPRSPPAPLRLLARPLSRQSHLGRPGALRQDPAREAPGGLCLAARGAEPLAQPVGPRGVLPPDAGQARGAQGDHRHRAQARADRLPLGHHAAALRRRAGWRRRKPTISAAPSPDSAPRPGCSGSSSCLSLNSQFLESPHPAGDGWGNDGRNWFLRECPSGTLMPPWLAEASNTPAHHWCCSRQPV